MADVTSTSYKLFAFLPVTGGTHQNHGAYQRYFKDSIPIIIPCHRVVGKNGTLTGYACGVWRKKKLLIHEGLSIRYGKVIQI